MCMKRFTAAFPLRVRPRCASTPKVGSVTVRAWDKPAVDLVAVKDAPNVDVLKNVAIGVGWNLIVAAGSERG